jgi:3-oxoacyl-[acyl-carrier-protein] synthase III
MMLNVRPTVPMRLLATAMAMPLDIEPAGQHGRLLDNDAVCEAVLGPDWRAQMKARAEQVPGDAEPFVVQSRQWVRNGATAIDLGVTAARRALEAAGLRAQDLSAILCVTSTPPVVSAAMAARIGVALGCDDSLGNACCFDVRAGGVGVMLAWFSAQGLIAQGSGPVLIVAAEASSSFMSPGDVGSAMLYADGAAACILAGAPSKAHAGPDDPGFLGGMSGQMKMQGRPTTIPGTLPPRGDLSVYRFQRPDRTHLASLKTLWGGFPRELAAAFPEACAALKHFLPYPVSLKQMAVAHEAMGQPRAEIFHQLERHGCLGAASPLASLHGLLSSGRARSGDVLALASGAGNGLWAGFFWRIA